MTDHRRLQRTLFRMQHDPSFAARLRAGDAGARASTGLQEGDLALLSSASASSVEADAGGRRLAQFLRNVSSEHALTVARAASGADPALLAAFPSSEEFHRAVRDDLRLPLAFARHARRRAAAAGDALLLALAVLEEAMARARRGPFPRGTAPSGGLVLSPRAEALEVPEGSLRAAAELRQALDAGAPPPPGLKVPDGGSEAVLVLGEASSSPHRLGEAGVELLSPLAGELLLLAREPLGAEDLATFCASRDVTAGEIAGFLEGLAADGVLVRG